MKDLMSILNEVEKPYANTDMNNVRKIANRKHNEFITEIKKHIIYTQGSYHDEELKKLIGEK